MSKIIFIYFIWLLILTSALNCGSCFSCSGPKEHEHQKIAHLSTIKSLLPAYSFIDQGAKELSCYNLALMVQKFKNSEFKNQCAHLCATKEDLDNLIQLINRAHTTLQILEKKERITHITLEDVIQCIYQVRAHHAKIDAIQKLVTQYSPDPQLSTHEIS